VEVAAMSIHDVVEGARCRQRRLIIVDSGTGTPSFLIFSVPPQIRQVDDETGHRHIGGGTVIRSLWGDKRTTRGHHRSDAIDQRTSASPNSRHGSYCDAPVVTAPSLITLPLQSSLTQRNEARALRCCHRTGRRRRAVRCAPADQEDAYSLGTGTEDVVLAREKAR
jgi:hypothetical protein